MIKFALGATILALAFTPVTTMAADNHVAVSPDQLSWKDGPPSLPKGAQFTVVAGDPTKDGLYVIRLKVKAGYKVPPHVHPFDENVTVLQGSFNIGMGAQLDDKKGHSVKVGGFAQAPKGEQHYAWFTEDSIIQIHGMGPQGITYVNPADDPRKSN